MYLWLFYIKCVKNEFFKIFIILFCTLHTIMNVLLIILINLLSFSV